MNVIDNLDVEVNLDWPQPKHNNSSYAERERERRESDRRSDIKIVVQRLGGVDNRNSIFSPFELKRSSTHIRPGGVI